MPIDPSPLPYPPGTKSICDNIPPDKIFRGGWGGLSTMPLGDSVWRDIVLEPKYKNSQLPDFLILYIDYTLILSSNNTYCFIWSKFCHASICLASLRAHRAYGCLRLIRPHYYYYYFLDIELASRHSRPRLKLHIEQWEHSTIKRRRLWGQRRMEKQTCRI